MKLYIIRHAPAEERHIFAQSGLDDEFRPLTPKGVERMHQVLESFCKLEPSIDVFLTSPFKRCQETGEVLKEYYPSAMFLTCDHLKPDHSAKKLYEEIKKFRVDSLALIGHEPDLGQFISWLLFNQASDHFPIKKAGIAKLDLFTDGRVYLKWLLRPKLLINNSLN